MVNFHEKLRGEGPRKRMRIVGTDGWVEPGDKWMMMTLIHHPLNIRLHPTSSPHFPGGPTKGLGAADKWMMVTILG